ncbi:TPA: ERF family protein [Streptococcus suis]
MTMSFAELQTKMQIGKTSKQGVKYTFRNAEDIFTHFKTLNSGWEINVSDDLVEVGGRIFVKATATAKKDEETRQATRFSELDIVPILNTKDYKTGEIKQVQQMQVPQWTGAVSSYAGKYALQGLFGIGEEDVDSLVDEIEKKKEAKAKIPKDVVKAYEDAIQNIISRTGKNDGSITRWFCEKLGIAKISDMTMEQIALADGLIKKMENKQ